jgi:hypothetical protein
MLIATLALRLNEYHAYLKAFQNCDAAVKKEEESIGAGQAWKMVGMEKGLPKTWEEVEKMPKCDDVKQPDVKAPSETKSGAGTVYVSVGVVFAGLVVLAF